MKYEVYYRFRLRHPKHTDDDEIVTEFEIRKKLMLEAFPDKGTNYVLEMMKAKLKETHESKTEIERDSKRDDPVCGEDR